MLFIFFEKQSVENVVNVVDDDDDDDHDYGNDDVVNAAYDVMMTMMMVQIKSWY